MIKNNSLNKIYCELAKEVEIKEDASFSTLVNFNGNRIIPRHRWFYFKEGYSPELINIFIKKYNLKKGDYVFDPFCGSGTTLLAAKEKGINAIGTEINPFLTFLTNTKISNYTNKDREKILDILGNDLFKCKSCNLNPPKLTISHKLFPNNLNIIMCINKNISKIKNIKIQNFFRLGLLSVLEDCSTAKKDGNGLKYPKNKTPKDIKKELKDKILLMVSDIDKVNNTFCKVYKENITNTRKIDSYRNKIKLVIFSPPYLNCFDYTEVYKMELWFGGFIKNYLELQQIRANTLTSHINKTIKDKTVVDSRLIPILEEINKKTLWNKKISLMILNYFIDMNKSLTKMYYLLKKGGHCVIVVGNSSYNSTVIPTDLFLANIGRNIGFKKAEIIIARKLGTSSQQYKSINSPKLLRESIIILEK